MTIEEKRALVLKNELAGSSASPLWVLRGWSRQGNPIDYHVFAVELPDRTVRLVEVGPRGGLHYVIKLDPAKRDLLRSVL